MSRPNLGLTSLLLSGYWGFFPGLKQLRRDYDYLHPSSAEAADGYKYFCDCHPVVLLSSSHTNTGSFKNKPYSISNCWAACCDSIHGSLSGLQASSEKVVKVKKYILSYTLGLREVIIHNFSIYIEMYFKYYHSIYSFVFIICLSNLFQLYEWV